MSDATPAPDQPAGQQAHSDTSGAPEPLEVLEENARAAVAAWTAARRNQRRPGGQFAPGHAVTVKSGVHSEQLASLPEVQAWHAAQVAAIVADLGGEPELSTLKRAHVVEAARLGLVVAALGDELLAGGPLTRSKGRARAALMLYLDTHARWVHASKLVGLERRTKGVTTFAEALRS